MLPVMTLFSFWFAGLLGGSVVIEVIFNIPGMGRLLYTAVVNNDVPVIQGGMMRILTLAVMINTATDLLYGVLNPAIRVAAMPSTLTTRRRRPQPQGADVAALGAARTGPNVLSMVVGGGLTAGTGPSTSARSLLVRDPGGPGAHAVDRTRTTRPPRTWPTGSAGRRASTGSAPTTSAGTCCPG